MLVAAGLLGAAEGANGQPLSDGASQPTARTFGTVQETIVALSAEAFAPYDQASFDAARRSGIQRFCFGASCSLLTPLVLPAGAVITAIELDAVDGDVAGSVTMVIAACGPGQINCTGLGTLTTGAAPAPGSIQTRLDLTPHTVDNQNNTYFAQVNLSGGTSMTRLANARVFYRLQVSPAPAVASFFDVPPGHDFFRFIEALARSGITSGCGGGNFCPDAPLTRGQMAAFLSIALGLHFAP
jgi:hypothetical protein